jgi:rRNA maturation endonuclease Nob1
MGKNQKQTEGIVMNKKILVRCNACDKESWIDKDTSECPICGNSD